VRRDHPLDIASRNALAAASEWRLLGVLLERPREGWREQIEALSRGTPSQPLRAAARVAGDASEGAYLALLGPGGSISPREIAYRGMEDPGRILAEIAAYYEAFAFKPAAEDPIDHAALECGFIGYLHLKEAFAVSRRDEEAASVARRGAERFLEEHVRYWAGPVAKGLARAGAPHLLFAAREILRRAGPPPVAKGPWGAVIPIEDGSDGCGSTGCDLGDSEIDGSSC
jgi:hypothetical protein